MLKISKEIGKTLKYLRVRSDVSLEDAAIFIGKSRATLARYESGSTPIDIDVLWQLAVLYKTGLCELLELAENLASAEGHC